MSKTKTWMPVYIGDYLADTMRLSTQQHGAYFLIMMEYWRQGPLPDDMDELASIVRADRKTWDKSIWPTIKRFFFKGEDGFWHQKRIDKELEHAQAVSNKRRDAVLQRRDRISTKEQQNTYKSSTNEGTNVPDLNIQNAYKEGDTCASRASASPSPSHSYTSSLRSDGAAMPPRDVSAPGEPIAPELSPDVRTQLFSEGLRRLRGITGQSEGKSRALIGRWLKAKHDDASEVLRAIREAADLRPSDPVAWMEAAMRPKPRAMTRDEQVRATWGNIEIIPGT
ncbi:YdaU family protein [Acetobacter thailandicus]|uniref:YdaU family protein n=1 Tax=Acetobacter thailandicus TaxID=1502842 RepID=UPI001BA7CD6C|nr:DUF1376 domain-containing protein [Acetobacter thailandicus]MBS0959799.1 YdaU family protein [Acetobacter thailandicus]